MSATIGQLIVLHGDVTFLANGAWSGDFGCINPTSSGIAGVMGTVPTVGSQQLLTVDNFTWLGTIIATDVRVLGEIGIRMIGGLAGAYSMPCKALSYANGPTLQVVATDLLAQHGEALNTALTSASLLQTRLPTFTTFSDRTLAANVTCLAKAAGCSWRVDPTTGQAYFIEDTFSTICTLPTNAQVTDTGEDTYVSYDVPTMDNLPLPGQTDSTQTINIETVQITIAPSRLHLTLYSTQLGSFLQLPVTSGNATATYAGTVSAQAADGSLTIIPDDPTLANISSVKVAVLPNTTINVQEGARAYFTFANGDPSQAFVVSFDGSSPGLVSVNIGGSGVPVALSSVTDQNFQNLINAITSVTPAAPYETGLTALIASLKRPPFEPYQSTAAKMLLTS